MICYLHLRLIIVIRAKTLVSLHWSNLHGASLPSSEASAACIKAVWEAKHAQCAFCTRHWITERGDQNHQSILYDAMVEGLIRQRGRGQIQALGDGAKTETALRTVGYAAGRRRAG